MEVVHYLEIYHVAKARSFHLIDNLLDLCVLEGLDDLKFKYIGGRWVLIKSPKNFCLDKNPKARGLN